MIILNQESLSNLIEFIKETFISQYDDQGDLKNEDEVENFDSDLQSRKKHVFLIIMDYKERIFETEDFKSIFVKQ